MTKTKGDGDGDGRHSQGITTTSKAPYYTQEGVIEDVPGKDGVSREISSSGGTSSKEVTTTTLRKRNGNKGEEVNIPNLPTKIALK
jgi:hypothetical protein